jgi:hypothetical protein
VAVLLQPHDPNQPAAAQALRQLASWAGDPEAAAASTNPSTVPAPTDRPREAEQLAMQAAAFGAAHRYKDVAAMDRALARRLAENRRRDPSTGPATAEAPALGERFERHREAVEQSLATAQRMDALKGRQDQVAQQTTAGDAKKIAELAGSQEAVANEIAEVQKRQGRADEEPTWRDRAAAELLHAQEQLAVLPQRLAEVQSAAVSRAAAVAQANDAKKARDAAPPEQRTVAGHSAEQAEKNAATADEQLQKTLSAIVPDVAHGLSIRLSPFAPESADARSAIDNRLAPSLTAVAQAAKAGDVAAIERAVGDARQAIELAQRHLAAAQDAVTARDPLLAAKWYARAAADSLSLQPPDVSGARAHQQQVSAALSRVWDHSIRRAASERLAELPALQTVLSPAPPSADPNGVLAAAGGKFSAAREWGRIRPPESPDVIAPLHDTDPVGFEEAIKLYFQAISKAQGGMR